MDIPRYTVKPAKGGGFWVVDNKLVKSVAFRWTEAEAKAEADKRNGRA